MSEAFPQVYFYVKYSLMLLYIPQGVCGGLEAAYMAASAAAARGRTPTGGALVAVGGGRGAEGALMLVGGGGGRLAKLHERLEGQGYHFILICSVEVFN